MSGLLGFVCNETARYHFFTMSVRKLQTPEGWYEAWEVGGDWCGARNRLAQTVLEEGLDYLWYMDDDHVFQPDMLLRQLKHEKDVLIPLCLMRQAPFSPVAFAERLPDSEYQYLPVPLNNTATDATLVPMAAGGAAGMLIHRRVLEGIDPPWFEYADRSEDIIFCEKAKAAGFEIWCDLSIRLGHITTATVWPAVRDGKWVTGFSISAGDHKLFSELAWVPEEE